MPTAFIQPTEKAGEYRLDLIDALRHSNSGHTSKRLLVPFFQQGSFTRLEITCDHLPKWFTTLEAWQLTADVVPQSDGTLCVTVMPQHSTTVP